VKTTLVSFPDYETPIGREIKAFLSGERKYPNEVQHLLFAANRWEKYRELQSHLRAGETIIVNRYTQSNLAYGSAKGLGATWLANLENGLPKADLVIVLDASPTSLRSRRAETRKDDYEKSPDLQSKARMAYKALARKMNWKLVDADGSMADVQARVLFAVRRALKRDRRTSV